MDEPVSTARPVHRPCSPAAMALNSKTSGRACHVYPRKLGGRRYPTVIRDQTNFTIADESR